MTTALKPDPPLTVNDVIAFIGNEALRYSRTSYIKVVRHETYAEFEVRLDKGVPWVTSVSHFVMASPATCKEYLARAMQRQFAQ